MISPMQCFLCHSSASHYMGHKLIEPSDADCPGSCTIDRYSNQQLILDVRVHVVCIPCFLALAKEHEHKNMSCFQCSARFIDVETAIKMGEECQNPTIFQEGKTPKSQDAAKERDSLLQPGQATTAIINIQQPISQIDTDSDSDSDIGDYIYPTTIRDNNYDCVRKLICCSSCVMAIFMFALFIATAVECMVYRKHCD